IQGQFTEALPDVLTRLNEVSGQIRNLTIRDERYQLLVLHGLTGVHLDLKAQVGRRASDALANAKKAAVARRPSRPASLGAVGRFLKPVLGWINSILGSL